MIGKNSNLRVIHYKEMPSGLTHYRYEFFRIMENQPLLVL